MSTEDREKLIETIGALGVIASLLTDTHKYNDVASYLLDYVEDLERIVQKYGNEWETTGHDVAVPADWATEV